MCQGRTQAFLHMKIRGTSYPSPFLKYLLEEDSIIHGSRKYAFKSLCFRRGWCHLESLCKMKVVTKCSFHGGAHSGWVCRPGFGRKPRGKCSRYPAAEPMPREGEEVLQAHRGGLWVLSLYMRNKNWKTNIKEPVNNLEENEQEFIIGRWSRCIPYSEQGGYLHIHDNVKMKYSSATK